MEVRGHPLRYVLLGLLVGGVLANVVQLPWIEAEAPRASLGRTWYRNVNHQLVDVVQEPNAPSNVHERYLLPMVLRQELPGVRIVRPHDLPANQVLRPSALIGIGGVSDITDADYQGRLFPGVDELGGDVLIAGEGGDMGEPYEVIIGEGVVETLVVFFRWDPLRFRLVDASLLPSDLAQAANR